MRQDDRGFAKLKRYIENMIGGGAEVCCLLHDEDSKVSWPISVSIKNIYIYILEPAYSLMYHNQ